MKYNHKQAIKNYITYEDLYEKAGYRVHKPKITSMTRALIELSKNHRSIKWLKSYLDSYFKKLRENKRNRLRNEHKKQNI